MCGIYGIVDVFGPGVSPELLWSGTHAVSHRGPDDWGFVSAYPSTESRVASCTWRDWDKRNYVRGYRVGFGNRRLKILDLSESGHQPMTLPGSDLWITFNGEIYNYVELRTELCSQREFTTDTDTEVLLASYQRWGTDCLARLNGMFAFAIWDGRRNRLILARDRFGEKPLYYSNTGAGLVFASELKQFLTNPQFRRNPDRSALADFLLFSTQDNDERTFLSDVKQLPSAHWIEFDADLGKLSRVRRYWMPDVADDLDTRRDANFHEQLRAYLSDSIRLRTRSDVPIGVCLSGGLDSAAICSVM